VCRDDGTDEAEQLSPRVVHNHYSQAKNGENGVAAKLNSILLACLLAIVGFLGFQLWNMNDRLARVETNVSTLLARP
jgi:hypothetical protein